MVMKYLKRFNEAIDQKEIIGGNADGKTYFDVVKKHGITHEDLMRQMAIGKLVQKEHTKSEDFIDGDDGLNTEISMDHLMVNPEYYSELIESGIVDEIEAVRKYIELFGEIKSEEAISKYKEKFGDIF